MLLGGLHDYISDLSVAKIKKIIKDYIDQNQELNDYETAVKVAKFGTEKVWEDLSNKSLDEIREVTLALEAYDREINNVVLAGGLKEYVDSLEQDDLFYYISNWIHAHPILLFPGKLDEVVAQYQRNNQ